MHLRRFLAFTALLALPALAASPACAVPVLSCSDDGPASAPAAPINLHGTWDFLMMPRGEPSFGLMAIGFVGADYGGALIPSRTAPVVLRAVRLTGRLVHLLVASREGDVRFDGTVSANGNTMCGTVTYHGGERFAMIAHRRPSPYRSPSQAERRAGEASTAAPGGSTPGGQPQ